MVAALLLAALMCAPTASAASPAECGPDDRPETGAAGPGAAWPTARAAAPPTGYTCNLTEVGFMPSSSFANFDTYENCAYYSDTIGASQRRGRHGRGRRLRSAQAGPDRLPDRAGGRATRASRCACTSSAGLLVADRYFLAQGASNADDPDANRVARHLRHLEGLPQAEAARRRGHAVRASATRAASRPTGWSITWPAPTRSRRSTSPTRAKPKQLSEPQDLGIHGCSTSEDGKRALPRPTSAPGALLIADTSEVQARKQNAQIKVIGELPTPGNDGPAVDDPDLLRRPPAHLQLRPSTPSSPTRARRGPTARRTSATR